MNIKNILSSIFIIGALSFSWADNFSKLYNYNTNYEEAREKALNENKPLFILFVTSTCPWCKKLENQTLSKPSIDALIQSNFVPLLLDKETDSFPKEMDPQVVPTIYFLHPKDEKSFGQIIGYKPQQEFLELLQKANKKYEMLQ